MLSPSALARLTGVSTDTLRHYERKRVLRIPARSQAGYRRYPPEAVAHVRLVRRALAIGFTLDDLAAVLSERDRGNAPCRRVRALVAERLAELETHLRDLTELRDELRVLLGERDRRSPGFPPECRRACSTCSRTDPLSTVPSPVSVAWSVPPIRVGDRPSGVRPHRLRHVAPSPAP
jgi:DNA-binding transcriptional MerR regulator